MREFARYILIPVVLLSLCNSTMAQIQIVSKSGIQIIVDDNQKTFRLIVPKLHWSFGGDLHGSVSNLHVRKGDDNIGQFEEIVFLRLDGFRYRCSIRAYDMKPVVIFDQEALDSVARPSAEFPVFSILPPELSLMTFSEGSFGIPILFRQFEDAPDSAHGVHSGVLALFDSKCNACIVSPAANFMIACITEDGKSIRCGLNAGLIGVPRGSTQSTIVVIDTGVNRAWDLWGHSLTDLYKKKRPSNEADVSLRYLSYWTDNGAAYYYNYDTSKGYEGTLLAVKAHYDRENIPIRSMQLDSWWYPKDIYSADGSPQRREKKAPNLPSGSWNHYGGMLEYTPDTTLFSEGLKHFRDSLGIPLITHSRWISSSSPYRAEYKISGIGSVDNRWWNNIMNTIHSWGVVVYEQDWLDRIYKFSPQFSTTTWAADNFLEDMANAASKKGLTMQYCMPLPRQFLQGGAKYSNLTSIRVSGDRFKKGNWKNFLYGSRVASALGVWPWSDVFMSRETPNILLSTLSAGVVGIGDSIGLENRQNIFRSVRSDGVIVKPDVPLTPIDLSYNYDVQAKGIRIASTYSDHGKDLRTLYVFAYADSSNNKSITLHSSALGIRKEMFLYDYFSGTGRMVDPRDSLTLTCGMDLYSYVVLSPMSPNGIAIIGDPEKFVTCGKNRITQLADSAGYLKATILVAKGEQSVQLSGYAPNMPQFVISGGEMLSHGFDSVNKIFKISVQPKRTLDYRLENGDAVGRIEIALQ